jgi:hypothetical protein
MNKKRTGQEGMERKRIGMFQRVILLIGLLLPLAAMAQFDGGAGTVDDPYLISTADHLNAVRDYSSSHFRMVNDVDLNVVPYNVGSGWVPIPVFTGTLDGGKFSVLNLYISAGDDAQYLGLFNTIGGGGQVRNLGVANASVSCTTAANFSYFGIIAADNAGTISKCFTSGTITNCVYYGGGIAGSNTGIISQCYSIANVSGNIFIGGITGNNLNLISHCYFRGEAHAAWEIVGGIAGAITTVTPGCIDQSYSTGLVTAGEPIDPLMGGLVGYNQSTGTVTGSYWNTETSGQATSDSGGEGKTTDEMKQQATYAGWDFVGVWSMDAGQNDGYPYLHWLIAVTIDGAFTAENKVYDGTVAATIGAGDTLTLVGLEEGDSVTLNAVATFDDKNTGIGKAVDLATSTLEGADADKYILSFVGAPTSTADITGKELSLDGLVAEDKPYDGTTDATISDYGVLTGVVGIEEVALDITGASAAFATATVGAAKAVTVVGLALTGADAGNYSIGDGIATADITGKELTIGPLGVFTVANKEYDGTNVATITDATGLTLVGVVGGDDVTLEPIAAFADELVAFNKVVSIADGTALSGTDVGNYTLSLAGAPTATADITGKTLSLDGLVAEDKPYDGTTAVTISNYGTLTGVVGTDDVALDTTGANAAFDTSTVGVGKMVTVTGLALTGADADNYTIGNAFAMADITQVPLTMVANPADGGTVEPAVGPHAYTVDASVEITATVAAGYEFMGWTVQGNATLGNVDSLTTTVTIHDDAGATVTANFAMDLVACGTTFWITAEEAGLGLDGIFNVKPKVYAQFDNPVSGKQGKAVVKVLTKIVKGQGANQIQCEWTKKIRLYNVKLFKAAEKAGTSAAIWIADSDNQDDLFLELHAASKEIPGNDQRLAPKALAVPVIEANTENPDGSLSITGKWFGTKAPKAWREYEVAGKVEGSVIIKRQALKVVKPTVDNTTFVDAKGKPACMNAVDGESKVIVILPAKDPKGALNGTIVIDNGVGMATLTLAGSTIEP